MWEYTNKVKDLYTDPKNVGTIEDADATAEVGSIVCGDALKLYLKIDKNNIITEAKFETFGCGSAIASSSALTEMIKGKTLDEALKISNQNIAEYLDGLPEEKMHCSVMGMEALEAAINSYRDVQTPKKQVEEGTIICNCFGVTDQKIIRIIEMNNLTTVEQVTNYTKAGGGCGQCKPEIEKILAEVLRKEKEKKKTLPRKMTNLEKIRLIQETLEKEIRPALRADGGNIELIDLDGNTVYVKLTGNCQNCPSMGFTIETFITQKLQQSVNKDLEVKEVKE